MKLKYDTVARLWKELPTNAELVRRQALTEEEVVSELVRVPKFLNFVKESISPCFRI